MVGTDDVICMDRGLVGAGAGAGVCGTEVEILKAWGLAQN